MQHKIFFKQMGTQNEHTLPFLESVSLKKRNRKVVTIEKIDKITIKGNCNIIYI